MTLFQTDKLIGYDGPIFSFGHSSDFQDVQSETFVTGFCLFQRYCWTNVFGWEDLSKL